MTDRSEKAGIRDPSAIIEHLADHVGQTVEELATKGLTATHQYYRGNYDMSALPNEVMGWAQTIVGASKISMGLLAELTRSVAQDTSNEKT